MLILACVVLFCFVLFINSLAALLKLFSLVCFYEPSYVVSRVKMSLWAAVLNLLL